MAHPFYAHSRENTSKEHWQLLNDHLLQTAEMASQFSKIFKGDRWSYIAGLLHDLGKTSHEFQEKIDPPEDVPQKAKTRVDHSTAGARYLSSIWPGVGKFLAYVITGHHGGLLDGKSSSGTDLATRLDPLRNIPEIRVENQSLFTLNEKPSFPIQGTKGIYGFQISFFIRMIFSSLIDADFMDTERFYDLERFELRGKYANIKILNQKLDQTLKTFKKDSKINCHRAEILTHCKEKAQNPPGIFTLNVPTGGGKTLSSLAFGLNHAMKNGMNRIIYTIPYTSIIDQNAQVFRNILGEDAIVEHHCNFNPQSKGRTHEDIQSLKHRLSTENWDRPVIVTTNVQFFESLFSHRVSTCRKLHNIAGSVIILDEAQMLPVKYLRPCLEALKELVRHYHCSVIICTATQPSLIKSENFPFGFEKVHPIIENPDHYHALFRRVQLSRKGSLSEDELALQIKECNQVLTIVNTRKRAAELFEKLDGEKNIFHLSARMCPVHRMEILACIRHLLDKDISCRVISTQLIEAGVDVDFQTVYREMAGLDSIIQAAGRCNREGKLSKGDIHLFSFTDGKMPKIFKHAAEVAESIFRKFKDPFSPDAVNNYFKQIYWLSFDKLDEKRILIDLEEGAMFADFPFRSVSEKFKLIENEMVGVIIPYDDNAEHLLKILEHTEFPSSILRKLQPYTVSIYENEFSHLVQQGAITHGADIYPILSSRTPFYNKNTGLITDKTPFLPEDYIF